LAEGNNPNSFRAMLPALSRPLTAVAILAFSLALPESEAQVTLTGTGYQQNFDLLGSGLPQGWSVWTSSTDSTLGLASTFNSAPTNWNAGDGSGPFRNSSGASITWGSSSSAQSSNSNRALAWRPIDAASRSGSISFAVTNTLNLTNFALQLTVFQANETSNTTNSYALEYRVGETGAFSQVGTSFTTSVSSLTNFLTTTYNISGTTLGSISNQSDSVFFRLRGLTGSTSGADTIAIDNFSLTYSAIPEPSTYGLILGAGALGLVFYRRHRKKTALSVGG
jgi:hypothetical protein